MINYTKPIPIDSSGVSLDGYPAPIKNVVVWNITNQVASSIVKRYIIAI